MLSNLLKKIFALFNPNKADIEILYRKENGELSKREIKIEQVENNILYGYCHLRKDNRSFRIDRIQKLTILSNNKILRGSQILEYFISNYSQTDLTFIDEGYFNDKVDNEFILYLNKDFHFIYLKKIEFDAVIINVGKLKNNNGYFLLTKHLKEERFSSLYVDRITEMYDLSTGEVISNPKKYFDDIYTEKYEVFKKEELEREEKRKARQYIEDFIEENLDLLKMYIYIAKSDGNINSKEKDILIETLTNTFPDIKEPLKIIDRVSKKHLYFNSYNSFVRNASKIISKYPEIDFLEFAEQIVSTQKTIHPDEEKILKYLSKKYNREYKLYS